MVFNQKAFTVDDLLLVLRQNYLITNGTLQPKQKIIFFIEDYQDVPQDEKALRLANTISLINEHHMLFIESNDTEIQLDVSEILFVCVPRQPVQTSIANTFRCTDFDQNSVVQLIKAVVYAWSSQSFG